MLVHLRHGYLGSVGLNEGNDCMFNHTLTTPHHGGIHNAWKSQDCFLELRALKQEAPITPGFFARHMRDPVYADNAFQRLHADFPSAVWLEAGSKSTITTMASRALGQTGDTSFHEVDLTGDNGSALSRISQLAVSLWQEGLNISYWPHHTCQTHEYAHLLLPPYQFENSKHWLAVKESHKPETSNQSMAKGIDSPNDDLFSFLGWIDEPDHHARFRIRTETISYQDMVRGHALLGIPVCPAALVVSVAYEALFGLNPDYSDQKLHAAVHLVKYQTPISLDPSRALHLDLHSTPSTSDTIVWTWRVSSTPAMQGDDKLHATGQFLLRKPNNAHTASEFARYQRLVGHKRCAELLNGSEAEDILQGRNLYRVFAEIVDYAAPYQGLKKVVGNDAQSAGKVHTRRSRRYSIDPHLSDCVGQCAGIWINCMTARPTSDIYVAGGFEAWLRSPTSLSSDTAVWDVYALHHTASEHSWRSDIFMFDSGTGELVEMILGVTFVRVSKASMRHLLSSKSNRIPDHPLSEYDSEQLDSAQGPSVLLETPHSTDASNNVAESDIPSHDPPASSTEQVIVRNLATLTCLDESDIIPTHRLPDIGIDSLVFMQLTHDLETQLSCRLSTMDEWADVESVRDVINCVQQALSDGR